MRGLVKCVLHYVFTLCVERGVGLIEVQDARVRDNRDEDALLLAAREEAALVNHDIAAEEKLDDEVVRVCLDVRLRNESDEPAGTRRKTEWTHLRYPSSLPETDM